MHVRTAERMEPAGAFARLPDAKRADIAAIPKQRCAAMTCPCGCGKVVQTWHTADCPDDCDID